MLYVSGWLWMLRYCYMLLFQSMFMYNIRLDVHCILPLSAYNFIILWKACVVPSWCPLCLFFFLLTRHCNIALNHTYYLEKRYSALRQIISLLAFWHRSHKQESWNISQNVALNTLLNKALFVIVINIEGKKLHNFSWYVYREETKDIK